MNKKLVYFLAIVATITIAMLINSCQDSSITPTTTGNLRTDAGNGCNVPNQFCGSPGTIQIQNPCPGTVQTIDLWAGVGNASAGVLVGHVEMYFVSGNTWTVKYIFTDPDFEASAIHFDIECALSSIPHTNNGNPKPGQFAYNFSGPFPGGVKEFNITLPTGCSCFFVAAHAQGTLGGHSCFEASIPPGCVTLSSVFHPSPLTAYWSFTLSNAGAFNGTYLGWCIDLGTEMQQNTTFTCARIYSSLDPLPACDTGYPYIEHPENFDKVNYLLNHFHVGDIVNLTHSDCSPAGGTGALTAIDIQKAIWILLDLGPGNDYQDISDTLRINAIICDVNANGEGYVPSCANGDLIAFIVIPDGENCPFTVQPILAVAPCCGTSSEQTAWGDGKYGGQFPGPNWATYFKWCPTCP